MSGFEIVGAVASAVQLASLSLEIIISISSLCTQIRDAPKLIRTRAIQVQSLVTIANYIERNVQLHTTDVECVLHTLIPEAVALRDILKGMVAREGAGIAERCWKAIGGVTKEKRIMEIFESLEREKSALLLCISSLNSSVKLSLHP